MNASIIKNIDLTTVEVVHISKKWDTGLFSWWYHVSVDYKKIAIVEVASEDGAAVEKMIANPPQGKRFAMTNYPNATSWDLVDLPPEPETTIDSEETEVEHFAFNVRFKNDTSAFGYYPWEHLESVKADPKVKSWEVRRIDGGESWVIAQSTNYAYSTVQEVMGKRHTENSRVIDGLLVEEGATKTMIYFSILRHSYSPYIEIVKNPFGNFKTMAVIGSVNQHNIDGFIKAVTMAKSLL